MDWSPISSLNWIHFLNLGRKKIECLSNISIGTPWKYIFTLKKTSFPMLSSIITETDLAFKAVWLSGYSNETSNIHKSCTYTSNKAHRWALLHYNNLIPLCTRDYCSKSGVVRCFAFSAEKNTIFFLLLLLFMN